MPTTVQNFNQANETKVDPDLMLLEFWQEFDTNKHRAVMNNEDVIFDGETYAKAAMEITLPNDGETQSLPSLSFSNIDRTLGRIALNATGKIICRMMIVDGSDYTINSGVRTYNTLLQDTENMMSVSKADVNILTVSGELVPKLDLQIPYPTAKTHRDTFPGVYL